MSKGSFTEKVTCGRMPKGGKGVGQVDGYLEKNAPGEGIASAKALRWELSDGGSMAGAV